MRPETPRGREDQRLPTHPGTSREGGRKPVTSLRGGEYSPSPEFLRGRGETAAPSVTAATTGHYCSYPEHLGRGGGRSPPAGGEAKCVHVGVRSVAVPGAECVLVRAAGPRPCGPARCGGLPRLQHARPEPRWSFSDWDRALCL